MHGHGNPSVANLSQTTNVRFAMKFAIFNERRRHHLDRFFQHRIIVRHFHVEIMLFIGFVFLPLLPLSLCFGRNIVFRRAALLLSL
jgi:hypothetical protein